MTITDIIISILSIFFLVRGATRGFMNSLLMPFSIIVATIASIIYFQSTKEMVISLLIGLIGPFILNILLKIFLKMLSKATGEESKPSFLSRLGGAVLTFAWGWVFIILTLILLAVFPPWGERMTAVHNDVIRSASYSIAKPWEDSFYASSKQNTLAASPASPNTDARSLAQDPRFVAVLQDPEVQKEVYAHDIVKLMSNPKMMELTKQIMNDPATLKKIMAIYSSGSSALTTNQAQGQSTNSQ